MSYISKRLKTVSKQSALIATGGAAMMTGGAQADVLLFADCDPDLICTELDLNVQAGKFGTFDLNGDGRDDFSIEIKEPAGREDAMIFGLKKDAIIGIPSKGMLKPVVLKPKTEGGVIADKSTKFLVTFGTGESVNEDSESLEDSGVFYRENDDVSEGPFAEEGTRGYIGLFIDTFSETDEFEGVTRNFGWLEVVRGSINALRIGFNPTPGAPAPIPGLIDVPEPASLPLMALGAAGLLAMRRKIAS